MHIPPANVRSVPSWYLLGLRHTGDGRRVPASKPETMLIDAVTHHDSEAM